MAHFSNQRNRKEKTTTKNGEAAQGSPTGKPTGKPHGEAPHKPLSPTLCARVRLGRRRWPKPASLSSPSSRSPTAAPGPKRGEAAPGLRRDSGRSAVQLIPAHVFFGGRVGSKAMLKENDSGSLRVLFILEINISLTPMQVLNRRRKRASAVICQPQVHQFRCNPSKGDTMGRISRTCG